MKILLTCPPMLRAVDRFRDRFAELGYELVTPEVSQILPESELIDLVPQFDGWIIGDDPATAAVFEAGKKGRLKAAVKWGVGVDNVDFAACQRLGIPITNTPGMFGREVADMAMGYVIALARQLFVVHDGIRQGEWPKPPGISLSGKTVGLVGFGDIGRNTARRLLASEMKVIAYDPYFQPAPGLGEVESAEWPARIDEADFLVFTCALTPQNRHMLNAATLGQAKAGVRVVNVARGPLIDEVALIAALDSGKVHSAALDVFEVEPLPAESPLRKFPKCLFGSHNGSNTIDAVVRTSEKAIELLDGFLKSVPVS
ncbi:MAG TPA: phosphoglycerate dehydrogenase [Chthoniobacterales bacterium]|nr:phosphoglycerate dehydrogenase [Chthoniobacterales bacterium]